MYKLKDIEDKNSSLFTNNINTSFYLDSIRIEHKASKRTALYVISLMRYRDTPFSRLVGLKGRRVHTILFLNGT